MPTTSSHLLPYPEASDPADVPADIAALAEAVDTKLDTIAPAQITGPTSGQLLIANASGVVTGTAVSGDVVISNTGDAQIQAGAVGTSELAPSAVTTAKIDNAAVTAAKQPDGLYPPPGAILQYGGASAPSGWLLCNGDPVDRTTYTALFTVIGTTYGSGNGSTTFNLPDFRGRMPVGLGSHETVNARGKNDGTAASNRRPAHNHTVNDPGHRHTEEGVIFESILSARSILQNMPTSNAQNTGTSTTGITVGSSGGSLDSPSFLVVNYIIRF